MTGRAVILLLISLPFTLARPAHAQIRQVTPELKKQIDDLAAQALAANPGDPTAAANQFNTVSNGTFGDIFLRT